MTNLTSACLLCVSRWVSASFPSSLAIPAHFFSENAPPCGFCHRLVLCTPPLAARTSPPLPPLNRPSVLRCRRCTSRLRRSCTTAADSSALMPVVLRDRLQRTFFLPCELLWLRWLPNRGTPTAS